MVMTVKQEAIYYIVGFFFSFFAGDCNQRAKCAGFRGVFFGGNLEYRTPQQQSKHSIGMEWKQRYICMSLVR